MTHLIAADARLLPLETTVPAGTEIVAGTPSAGVTPLTTFAGAELGVWEMTAGTARDVEADEIFVVLAGDATVRFTDGETIELRPGAVVRLSAGDHTEWQVRETLRKLYLAPSD